MKEIIEFHWPSRLLLSYRCTGHCITVWGDILDLDRDDIAAAKLAIDSQVKEGEVTYSPLHEQSDSNCPNVLRLQGRSRPDQLAFVPRHAVVGRCAICIVWMVLLLCYKDDEHAPRMRAAKRVTAS
jgi:ferredoxin